MVRLYPFFVFFWNGIASLSILPYFIFAQDTLKNSLNPLSHISFDTKQELPKDGVIYVISIGDRFNGRPHFSIYPENEFHDNVSDEDILARGVWQDKINTTGWSHLKIDVVDSISKPDNHKSYAAGVLEGYLSRARIRDFFLNTRGMINAQKGGRASISPVREIFKKSISRVKNIGVWDEDSPLNSGDVRAPVEQLVRLAVFQIWGISDGYEAARLEFHPNELADVWPKIDVIDMHLLSADGDFPDLKDAVPLESNKDSGTDIFPALANSTNGVRSGEFTFLQTRRSRRRRRELPFGDNDIYVGNRRRQYGRCSALVRLAPDNSELFVGHSTWEPFSEMTRVIKYYNFPFKGVGARQLAFPSYPGAITSTDDFIITSAGLVLTETTIDVKNRTLFREKSNTNSEHGYFPDFIKPIVGARLATNSREWIDIFTRNAHKFLGVASCQWMIVDYKNFKKGSANQQQSGLLYVLEGIPGLILSKDMTRHLIEHGYWASTNRAWFRDVRNVLGDDIRQANDVDTLLSVFARNDNPRAFAFKHLAPKVDSLQDMERLMQFSGAPPEAGGPPAAIAIAPRFDLGENKNTPEGATDSKIVDSSLVHDLSFIGISGPEHQRHVPFTWTDEKSRSRWDENVWPHRGMPLLWNFTWQRVDKEGLTQLPRTPGLREDSWVLDSWSDELKREVERRKDEKRIEDDNDDHEPNRSDDNQIELI